MSVATSFGRRTVVLSPHLDDAVLSLGATLWSASRAGGEVVVATLFAGDPASTDEAGYWDRRAGFATAGEAATCRRKEDARACRIVGASPVWLPFADDQYGDTPEDDEVWAALEGALANADTILIPGFPLAHRDHAWATTFALRRIRGVGRVGFYVEQPYAMMFRHEHEAPKPGPGTAAGIAVEWRRSRPQPLAWMVKQLAARQYRSQLAAIARPLQRVPLLVALHELRAGGEGVAWLRRNDG